MTENIHRVLRVIRELRHKQQLLKYELKMVKAQEELAWALHRHGFRQDVIRELKTRACSQHPKVLKKWIARWLQNSTQLRAIGKILSRIYNHSKALKQARRSTI